MSTDYIAARAAEIAAIVRTKPGIGRDELARHFSITPRSLCDPVRYGAAAGMFAAVGSPGLPIGYYPPEQGAQALADAVATRAARIAKAHDNRLKRNRLREKLRRMQDEAQDDEAPEPPPVHRLIPAGACKPLPFVCKAAASVFHLGGML